MLSQQERDQLALQLFEMALFYGKSDLTRESVTATINLYESFFRRTLTEYLDAIRSYMADQKNIQFPAPARLRPYLDKELDDDSKAVEVASRVVAAVSRFGYTWPSEAKNYIGDLGWEAVQRFGGWTFVCENLGVGISQTTFQAQIRDSAKAIIKTAKMGAFDQAIGLPAPNNNVMKLVNIKSLNSPEE